MRVSTPVEDAGLPLPILEPGYAMRCQGPTTSLKRAVVLVTSELFVASYL